MRRIRLICIILLGVFVFQLAGCASAGGDGILRAGRTASEKEYLVEPGMFGVEGKPAAADNRRRYFDFWNEQVIRQDAAVSTVFMGDSITEIWNLPVYFQSHRGIIQNRGIGGDLASNMAKRFQGDVVQLRPRNVVILAGTNDVSRMVSADKSDEEIVSGVTGSIEAMIDAGKAAGINVVVCSILPTNSDHRTYNKRTVLRGQINERVKRLCREKGCIYVDYAPAVSDADGNLRKDLARDGLHPHYAGYEIMARVLQEAAAAADLEL